MQGGDPASERVSGCSAGWQVQAAKFAIVAVKEESGVAAVALADVDSLFLAHLSSSFDIGPGELQIGLKNLFDKRYYSILAQSHNLGSNWIAEEGRRVSISYSTKW